MEELASLIATSHASWMPRVVNSVLGTNDPFLVADLLLRAVTAALAVPVVGARFYEPGVGIVVGLELADGRAIVAKVHRTAFVASERLAAIAHLQADLITAGVPAPSPLAGPLRLGDGWLTIQELRDGDRADGSDPIVRRNMAIALHHFVVAARPHAQRDLIDYWLREPVIDNLWPEPHDLRFDFQGTARGAEAIDDMARTARATLSATTLPTVVGHLDWRVQNLAFAGKNVCAIYDWDSVAIVPEAALVGCTSLIHPVDFRLALADPFPTLDGVDGFVEDYESSRGMPFNDVERDILAAAQRWVACYGARCQHSDATLGLLPGIDPAKAWARLLSELIRQQ